MSKLELICERCDRDYPVWSTENETWNEVIRDEVAGDSHQFLCPTCFVVRASMMGITPIWNLIKKKMSKETIKKCYCISRNQPEEYQNVQSRKMKMLCAILPDGTKRYKDVYIDECIADRIQELWDMGVFTESSCCGHNGNFPKSIVISDKEDLEKAKKIFPDFEICYWELIRK